MARIVSLLVTYDDGESDLLRRDAQFGGNEAAVPAAMAAAVETRSRQRPNKIGNPESPTSAVEQNTAAAGGSTAPTSGSRRPRPGAASSAQPEAAPTTTSSNATGRRPRPTSGALSAAATTQSTTTDAGSAASAQAGRRPRPTSAAAQPAASKDASASVSPDTAKNASRTRPRNAGGSDAPTSRASDTTGTKSPSKISDADVSKACSVAASRVGPKAVMEVLRKYGVDQAQKLPDAARRAFVDELKGIE